MHGNRMNVIAVLVTFALLVAGCANTGSSPRTASSQDLSSSQQDRLMSEIKREKAVAARTEDPVARSNQLMLVGHYELMLENLPSGLQYYEKARQLRMDAGEIAMARESTYAMASALSLHGKLEQAMVQLEQDLERYGEPDKASGSAKVHQLLARLYVDTGRFEKGARSARIAADQLSGLHRQDEAADIIYYEAIALNELGRRAQAEDLLRRSHGYFHQRAALYDDTDYAQKARLRRSTARQWGVDVSDWTR